MTLAQLPWVNFSPAQLAKHAFEYVFSFSPHTGIQTCGHMQFLIFGLGLIISGLITSFLFSFLEAIGALHAVNEFKIINRVNRLVIIFIG